MAPTLWLNQHLTNTWHALRHLCLQHPARDFRLLCTHRYPNYVGARYSDAFEQEPRRPSDEEYIAFAQGIVQQHGVEVVYPWRKLSALLRARQSLEALGARIHAVADLSTLELLESKVRQYRSLSPDIVPIPDHEVVNTVAGFDAAVTRLRSTGQRICYKPAVSIFGFGFHILADTPEERQRWQAGETVLIPIEEALRALAAKEPFPDQLVMPYLPGPERSIDCLAHHGELLRCVVRCKSMKNHHRQLIEDNPEVEEIARKLTAQFRLNAVFNIQLRDSNGIPYLLEINPRMSGGVPAGCCTGLNLLYWSMRLALGPVDAETIPRPQTGMHINTAEYPGSR